MPGDAPRRLAGTVAVLAATLLALALAELGLRARELLAPAEQALDYGDVWREGGLGEGGFLKEGFSGRVRDGYGGTVRWVNDAAGFRRDEEVVRERAPGSLRVLSLGDSFTAGYRVDQEETFSHLLERHLEATGRWREAEVLISVIESPPFGLLYLERHGLGWKPDLVLLGLTLGNDVSQTYVTLDPRGELRLAPPGEAGAVGPNPEEAQDALIADLRGWTLPPGCIDPEAASPPPPADEPETGGLRLVRLAASGLASWRERERPWAVTSLWGEYRRPLLFDNHGLGLYLEPPPPRIRDAYARLFATLRAYRDLCRAHGVGFAVAPFPQRFQVQERDWRATLRAYGLDPGCFDLMAPNRRIGAFCREAGIPCIDPAPAMARRFEESGRSLYLPRGDMHWNARGHRAFFEAAAEAVEELARARPTPRPPAPARPTTP
jgi:hypothetical protein